MRFPQPVQEAELVQRHKRFLADVRLDDGTELTAHCPDPGRMTGLAVPGHRVLLSDSGNPKRKLRWTLELIHVGTSWVGVNTARANELVEEGLRAGKVVGLTGWTELRREVPVGDSRLDFFLDGPEPCFVEVKNVTLARGELALFPDAVTARGLRHLEELIALVASGRRAVLLLIVNRSDCSRFAPAADVDPDYAAGLRRAVDAGVELLVQATRPRRDGITLGEPLPWDLG
ncbi:MAG: DNA/RNA nuclease SfsA [Acidobacteriota bacterium]